MIDLGPSKPLGAHAHTGAGDGGDLVAYILAAGTRAFTGNQSLGGFSLTNVNDVGCVTLDVSTYAAIGSAASPTAGTSLKIAETHDLGFGVAGYGMNVVVTHQPDWLVAANAWGLYCSSTVDMSATPVTLWSTGLLRGMEFKQAYTHSGGGATFGGGLVGGLFYVTGGTSGTPDTLASITGLVFQVLPWNVSTSADVVGMDFSITTGYGSTHANVIGIDITNTLNLTGGPTIAGTLSNLKTTDNLTLGTLATYRNIWLTAPTVGGTFTMSGVMTALYIEKLPAKGTAQHEIMLATTGGIFFRDSAISINSATDGHLDLDADVSIDLNSALTSPPDAITATHAGVAASLVTLNTEVTTNGDGDLDNVTLANGISGQIKHIYCVVEGNAADTWKITPATMCGGTQITFAGVGEGCTLIYGDNEGWVVIGNNGGVIT